MSDDGGVRKSRLVGQQTRLLDMRTSPSVLSSSWRAGQVTVEADPEEPADQRNESRVPILRSQNDEEGELFETETREVLTLDLTGRQAFGFAHHLSPTPGRSERGNRDTSKEPSSRASHRPNRAVQRIGAQMRRGADRQRWPV
jgi:hypothetical protein